MFRMKDIYTLDMEWDGTEAWFICAYTNILFKLNSEDQSYTFVAPLPQNGIDNYDFHSQCVKYGEVIYCLPNRGQDIYIYDISKTTFRKIDLNSTNGERINLDKLCVVGDTLYTISYGMGQVIEINLKDEKIVNRYPITEENISIYKAIMHKNNIYAVSTEKDCLISFDLDKRRSQCISITDNLENKRGFCSLGHTKNQIWMCGYDNNLYSYDLCKKKVDNRLTLPDDIKFYDFDNNDNLYREKRDGDFYFQECVCFNDSIWFIPYQSNKIMYIKAHENIIKEMVIEDEEETVKSMKRIAKKKYFVVKIESEKNFIIKSFKNECLYRINVCDETVERIPIELKYANLNELMIQYGKNNKVMSEISAVDRNLYIYKIFYKTNNNLENKENIMVGENIHNKLID